MEFQLQQIGQVRADRSGFSLLLEPAYKEALTGLDGFSHIQALWWFSGCDNAAARSVLTADAPYADEPDEIGVFATRSPMRPNPIALSCAEVTYIDHENGVIGIAYIDAEDGSPLLDIKPYTPSLDRVQSPAVPAWCAHWPNCTEDSGSFDWASVFRF